MNRETIDKQWELKTIKVRKVRGKALCFVPSEINKVKSE